MFLGKFDHAIDVKGRVSIPARFRDAINGSGQPEVVLTRCLVPSPPCLEAWSREAWQRLEEDARKLPRFEPSTRVFENVYLGHAQICEIDAQGRILIPPALREWAHLKKKVVFSGARDRFRVWSPESWDEEMEGAARALEQDPEILQRLSL